MLLTSLSAFFSGLSQHSIGFHNLIYVSIIPLVYVLNRGLTLKASIKIGFVWGFIYVITTIYWLAFNIGVPFGIGIISMLAAVLFLSLNYIFICLTYYFFQEVLSIRTIFLLPSIWISVEFLRSFFALGFPWISIGNTQAYNYIISQNAELFGIYGISFWIILINVLFYQLLKLRSLRNSLILFIIFILPFGSGFLLERRITDISDKMHISVIQPNVHLSEKRKVGYEQENIIKLIKMSMINVSDSTDLIIWPETATISYLLQNNKHHLKFIQNSLRDSKATLLTGLPYYERDENNEFIHYNSIAQLSADSIIDVYHKTHLVPIAERVPLASIFPFLKNINIGQANFEKGTEYTIFNVNDVKIGAMVCFESTFPQLNRKFVNNGAEVLVYLVNDGWYENEPEPLQHAKQARFRAIEFRKPVIRCANTGVSQVIDQHGNIVEEIELNKAGVINASVLPSTELTFYAKYGDIFAILNLLLLLILLIKSRKNV